MLQASHGPYYTFFSIHLAEIGYGKFSIGTLWALGVLAEVGLFLVMHKVLARFPMRTIMLCAATLTAAFRWLVIAEFSAILWILPGGPASPCGLLRRTARRFHPLHPRPFR